MDHARSSSSRRVYGDLRQLAEDLQLGDFTALSVGIGIGQTQARTRLTPPQAMATAAARMPQVFAAGPSFPAPALNVSNPPSSRSAPAGKIPFELRLVAWGLDLMFVALAAFTALALATLLAAMRGGQPPMTADEWMAVRPMQWLASLPIYAWLGGLYGIYGAYMALFKIVAGRTLGESLFFRRRLVPKA